MAFTATNDLLLPATVTGSWPRPRWYTANMSGRPLDTAMMDPWFREQFTDAHEVVVADQARAGLDIVTTGDYHLDGASPAVDAPPTGSGTGSLLAEDVDGEPRPAGAGPDTGADEVPGAKASAGAEATQIRRGATSRTTTGN